MNLIFFLGSGVSIESGHPNVVKLTEQILNAETHPETVLFLRCLADYDSYARNFGGTRNLSSHETVGEIYRNYTSYEDLYYLCDEIALFDWGLHDNAMVPAFMESLLVALASILKGETREKRLLEIGKLGQDAKRYINAVIREKLDTPDKIVGLDLIVELAKSPMVTSLNILTLNHDLLVESILERNGIAFADGFGKADGDVRWFEPDIFLADIKVKLIKLHGSVDWYSLIDKRFERIGKITGKNFPEKKSGSAVTLEFANTTSKILTGLNKIKFYNSGLYTDLHYHFQKVLYENDIMIMSGYGWGDDPINNRLMTWLDRKPERKLILLHEENRIQELKDRSMVFDRDYSKWTENDKLVPMGKWLSGTTIDEITTVCK